eukprot:m.96841 g.96841  ORF g.96841 m.96841 type:complete len:213 (-) comp16673_c0_seq1:195-833(-)
MGDEFHKSMYIDTTWTNKIKCVIFDFDKTITKKHTGGSVLLPVNASDDFIKSNFADLEFFKFCVPFIKAQGVHVAIASFGEEDAEAVLSGLPLIRKYLDLAFGATKSKDLFPDHTIALWHPEKKGKDERKVGKTDHIAEIVKKLGGKLKNSELVLFDDDANNISIGKKKGVHCFYCPATKDLLEEGKDSGFNRHIWASFIQKMKSGGTCVLM